MNSKVVGRLGLALAVASTLAASAGSGQDKDPRAQPRKPPARPGNHLTKSPKLVGGILLPGNPLVFDISWVDQARARYYLAESGNASVDVFDAENDLFLGRITGFHGVGAPGDPCGRIQGMGPSGILVTPNNQLWAADAHGTVKVFDLTNAQPPFSLSPIATISTGADCRADEIGFDPKDHVIMVGNPAEHPPFASVISSDPPYAVLAKITFPNARGFEQPLWDAQLKGGRMLATVPGNSGMGEVAVINLKDPKAPVVEARYPTPDCGSGLALGPSQHLLVGCGGGRPLLMLNGLNGTVITAVAETHGADEVWYNSGDNRFYAPSGFGANPTLSVIDADTGALLNSLPAGPGVHSVAAFRGNNHIFVPVGVPTATALTDLCNVMFSFPAKQGCIAVYAYGR
ncbi:MAG: hypothetical protein DMF92_12100 [Acidobacteria bacterium]|nr:MAG: hypothetical protein DMF92_12100 [Acidobacteriota bacterium]